MRASEILGKKVIDSDGKEVGRVFELEAEQSGPQVNDRLGRAWRVEHLLVGGAAVLLRLGFQHRHLRGPVGLRMLAHRLRGYRIPWTAIESTDGEEIRINVSEKDLSRIEN
ncbi:MAG: hypothetical protein QOG54_1193 [Actinomycetota bacterium]|jgi:hypothetical protein|nr:hypothetical protein [Actinomycetota bacterium]